MWNVDKGNRGRGQGQRQGSCAERGRTSVRPPSLLLIDEETPYEQRSGEQQRERCVADVLDGRGDRCELRRVLHREELHYGSDDRERAEHGENKATFQPGGEEQGKELDMGNLWSANAWRLRSAKLQKLLRPNGTSKEIGLAIPSPSRERGATHLDECRRRRVHEQPGCKLSGTPVVVVFERGDVDGDVGEHVGPLAGFLGSSSEDDLEGRDEGDEEGEDGGDLEGVVDGGKGPVVLRGKNEVNEEDGCESENNPCHENLYGKGLGKGRAEFEDGIKRERAGRNVSKRRMQSAGERTY